MNYPKSQFASQSLYVLSHYEPDKDWYHELETRFPQSEFLNQDSVGTDNPIQLPIRSKRDYAWSLLDKSYEESFIEFRRLHDEERDTLSAYISAFICDYYLNDIGCTVKHYQEFLDSFPDHTYFPQVENRLQIIKTDLEKQKEISKQGIDYKHVIQYFKEEKDFVQFVDRLDVYRKK